MRGGECGPPVQSRGPLEQRLAVAEAERGVQRAGVAPRLHVHERHGFPALVINAAAAGCCARFVRLRLAAGGAEQRLSKGVPKNETMLV